MLLALDRVDSAPIISQEDLDPQFLQWIWVLIDTLNENLSDIETSLNLFTAMNLAILTEVVTLSLGSPSFNVANGSLYRMGYNVVGNGIPPNSVILSIAGNTITITNNATLNGASSLNFIPVSGVIKNGIMLYDTTNNVYVGMQNNSLVKFTTTSYP